MRPVLVIVPLYRDAALAPDLFSSLAAAREDFAQIGGRLLIIMDPPDSRNGVDIDRQLSAVSEKIPTELLANVAGLGVIGAANRGLAKAIEENCDALILKPNIAVFPGTLVEMRTVAYLDHMIGFVGPRSNDRGIGALPHDDRSRSSADSHIDFRLLSPHLPRFHYVPTTAGPAMYIKWIMLREFGDFDPTYASGTATEHDMMMRANQCGYRCALANRAFVYSHQKERAPPARPRGIDADREILDSRYPEFERSMTRYWNSPEFRAEVVLAGLLPDKNGRPVIAFDFTIAGAHHNGTVEAAKAIVSAAAEAWRDRFSIEVIASAEVAAFHRLGQIHGVTVTPPGEAGLYAAFVRVGQPFEKGVADWMAAHAPVVCIYMLDTIALDCQHLDHLGFQDVWQHTLDSCDVVVYISRYSQGQFRLRYRIPVGTVEIAALLSTRPSEYACADSMIIPNPSVLVVGNPFPHKYLQQTVDLITRRYPSIPVVVLGSTKISHPNVKAYGSGSLSEEVVDRIFREARVVLFPSHYEGFGLPALHAIARKRPVVVRAMPLYDELATALGGTANLHQRETTSEMVDLACLPTLKWLDQGDAAPLDEGWARVVRDLEQGLVVARSRLSFDRIVQRFAQARPQRRTERPRVTVPMIRMANFIIVGVALASTLAIVLRTFLTAHHERIPRLDAWIESFVRNDWHSYYLTDHNGHLNLLSKFLFQIDHVFAGDRTGPLIVGAYAIQAIHVTILMLLARMAGVRGGTRLLLAVAVGVCCLFGALNYDRMHFGINIPSTIVFVFVSASFLTFALYAANARPFYLLISVGSAVVASLEDVTGLFAFPLLVMLSVHWGLSRKSAVVIIVGAMFVGGAYVLSAANSGYNLVAHLISPQPLMLIVYAPSHVGGFLGRAVTDGAVGRIFGITGDIAQLLVSTVLGLGLMTTLFWGILRARGQRGFRSIGQSAIVAVFLFAAMTAVVEAVVSNGAGMNSFLVDGDAAGGLATLSVIFLVLSCLPVEDDFAFRGVAKVGIAVTLAVIGLA